MQLIISLILILLATCTIAKNDDGRIVGGEDAEPHEFPYIVTINLDSQHWCGGSILNENWVVTAAHCQISKRRASVIAGVHDLTNFKGTEQKRKVTHFIIHEDFSGGVGPNDIAMIKVDQPFTFNRYVAPIKLPPPDTYPTGWALATGWGDMSRNGSGLYSNILQKVSLPIHSQKHCMKLWAGSPFAETNLCAAPLDGSTDSCNADSGGPLAQGRRINSVLVGLTSWGPSPCAVANQPGVYTWVSYFLDWIEKIQNEN